MQLMRLRIGDRFTWSVDVPAELNETTIPKLLIQPLVENALVHGISNKNGTGHVSVDFSMTEDGQYGRVTITDNGKGMTKKQVERLMEAIGQETPLSEQSTGIAMVNVNKRLKLYYPEEENSGISISSLYGQGTVCLFQWPLKGGALHE